MQMVDALIQRGAIENALGGRHGCALMVASSIGMLDLIRSLVSNAARVNDQNDKGTDSPYAACMAGNLDSVKLFLVLRADINAKGGKHRNAPNATSVGGHVKIVQCLLDAGADVEFFDEHYGNSVQMSASAGHADVLHPLGGEYGTPLIAACRGETSSIPIAEFLLESGADINASEDSENVAFCALGGALECENYDLCVILLNRSANVNVVNDCYPTPLLMAVVLEDDTFMNLIFDHGADINSAIEPRENQDEDKDKDEDDDDEDDEDTSGDFVTTLQCAEEQGSNERVRNLIRRGAHLSVGIENAMFCSALQAILLDAGSNVDNEGGMYATALQAAAAEGNEEIVRVLLEHGADPNIVGGKFGTALQAVSASRYYLMISDCLRASASIHLRGGQYGTPLSAALENSCASLVSDLLQHHGADPNASVRK
ncbi:hypothetical protein N7491_004277 [Penicillium cf. griseofulvum]|nr:hypothetical protein N7491_004277 [Penicillium cf. griseofulvum]